MDIDFDGINLRIARLDHLARGLAKEIVEWRKGDDPLLYLERRAYLDGLRDLLAGVETSRVVLVRARLRIAATRDVATGG